MVITPAVKENGSNVRHERLFAEITVKEVGLMYIYLSNDNVVLGGDAVDVFFDDFKVEHVKSPVVQMDDYYPFGLTFNSYSRENSVPNKFKFQGQEHIRELGLGWESFKWRNHQPDIGRFFNIDPLVTDFPHWSPYVFCGNMVTSAKELEGQEPNFMIHGRSGTPWDYKVTTPMATLLASAFGFSPESITKTRWYRDDDPRSHWFAKTGVPDNAVAMTVGEQVVYDHTVSGRSAGWWFSLIVHEQRHRDDIETYGGGLFFSYGIEATLELYEHDDIAHEQVANKAESYASRLWNYNGGEVQRIFQDQTLSGSMAHRMMESVGARFRRDVILSDFISNSEQSISTVRGAINTIGPGRGSGATKAALLQMIKSFQSKIDKARKEQQSITERYGH